MIQPNTFDDDLQQSNLESDNPDNLLNSEAGASLDTDLALANVLQQDIPVADGKTEINGFASEANSLNEDSQEGEGLNFVFNFAENVPQEIRDNMGKAGEAWSSVISDDVTVQIDVGYELDTDGLANADSETTEVPYSEFRQALNDKASSEDDAIAIANLPEAETVNLLINNTQENQGSDDVYLDDNSSENNSTIAVNTSTAKALGLDTEGNTSDAAITFDQTVNWDYDAGEGTATNAIDFENVAIHEIGHVLGFNASVDSLDEVAGQNLKELILSGNVEVEDIAEALSLEVEELENLLAVFGIENIEEIDLDDFEDFIAESPAEPLLESIQPDQFVSENLYLPNSMDLFRYSDLSSDLGVNDFTVGERDKYFSIDGGATEIATFSTGTFLGDGRQISHWQDDLSLGVMEPTYDFETGEIGSISSNDLQLLDVIGWDIV